jgi:hypothetical protein
MYTPYSRADGMLLHINGEIEKFVLSLLISRIRPRYEADLAVSVVSYISGSI